VERESRGSSESGEIKLIKNGEIYHVPVLLNRTTNLNFIIDSGASDVSIPPDIILKLVHSGTVDKADFIGIGLYTLADGSKVRSPQFFIREIILGDVVVRNVKASIGNLSSPLLLGQSFLSKFQS
jgi:predicted aspartyl protease